MAAEPEAKKPRTEQRPRVLFILGGPGSGKGTMSEKILEFFPEWDHVSAGDVLRAEKADPSSKDGELINNIIKEGKIVPTPITLRLIKKAMDKKMLQGKKSFLIDGYPRNLENLTGWQQNIGESAVDCGCLYMHCSEEVMEKRLTKRGETSGRNDDNLEAIKKRFKTYDTETMPIIERYRYAGNLYEVDSNPAIEDVWKSTKAVIQRVEARMKDPMEVRRQLWEQGGLRQASMRAIFHGGPLGQRTQYRLKYFVIRGLVELPQLLLEEAQVAYEIELLGMPEFLSEKSTCGPFGRMPLLLDYDGKGNDLAQTPAITRFLAQKLNFAGASDAERACADMIFCQYQDTLGNPQEFSAAALKSISSVMEAPKYRETRRANDLTLEQKSLASLESFEQLLKGNPDSKGKFLVGTSLTYVDVALFLKVFDWLEDDSRPSGGWMWEGTFPNISKHYTAMLQRPAIRSWLESPRRMPRMAPPNYTYVDGRHCPKP